MSRRTIVNTAAEAKAMRQTFTAKPLKRGEYDLGHRWPTELQHVGQAGRDDGSIMYASDKWKRDDDFDDYKHVAEGPQDLFLSRALRLEGELTKAHGPWRDLDGALPSHVAELADVLGIEARLFVGMDRRGEGVLGRGDDGFVQLVIPNAVLYGARKPDTGEAFLFLATKKEGVLVLVTGRDLDITRDGLIG